MKNIFLGIAVVLLVAALLINENQLALRIVLDVIVIGFILTSMFYKSKGKL